MVTENDFLTTKAPDRGVSRVSSRDETAISNVNKRQTRLGQVIFNQISDARKYVKQR